jgi:prepilin signal peptidase PulO-like enzyme (type II secretory pathway)
VTTLEALWWLLFFAALGLCIGSFLNAVIYRLPRNRSLRNPLWSFCPHCRKRIAWHDNLPIVSFILLRGRCRNCGVPISTRYVIVEAAMAIIVLMLIDAFFIGRTRTGLSPSAFGLTDRLATDWPILAAHVILFACLLPMSVIDLEHYWVDIRFTNMAALCGFVLHTFWTPRHSAEWVRPWDATGAVCLLAVIAIGLSWIAMICLRDPPPDTDEGDFFDDAVLPAAETQPRSRRPPPSLASPSRAGGWLGVLLVTLLTAALWSDEAGWFNLKHTGRALLPLIFFFVLIVRESTVSRAADRQIVEAIHEERHSARRMVLAEFMLLSPAMIGGVIAYLLLKNEDVARQVHHALHADLGFSGSVFFRHWSPLTGLTTAASGFVIAGALGWAVRIVFTLVFGKEAFGSGDIHMMAATGCVAGWPVVVLGFFLTCGIAMLGWLATLPFKRTRAVPLGPWLSLSFLTVVVFFDSIVASQPIQQLLSVLEYFLFENSQPRSLGVAA